MHSVTRYSVGAVVDPVSIVDTIQAFEAHWVGQFWFPNILRGDTSFNNDRLLVILLEIKANSVPFQQEDITKNPLESKQCIIQDIYIRLRSEESATDATLLAVKAVSFSNDLYGNEIASAFEFARGLTRPLIEGSVVQLPEIVLNGHEELKAY